MVKLVRTGQAFWPALENFCFRASFITELFEQSQLRQAASAVAPVMHDCLGQSSCAHVNVPCTLVKTAFTLVDKKILLGTQWATRVLCCAAKAFLFQNFFYSICA